MSACYYVSLNVRFTDEEKARQSLRDFIYNTKQTNFNLDHFKGHVDLDTIDGLLQVIIVNWDFCRDFRTDEVGGWISYNGNFNATYSWEGVLQEMFNTLLPYIDVKATLRIEMESDYYILGVVNENDNLQAKVLEEGRVY